jgi:hypothetical protein
MFMPGLLLGDREWSHPLISKPAKNVSRRHLFGLSGGALAVLAVGSAGAQSATPDTATPVIRGDDEAVSLLNQAVEAMTSLETFHFLIETTSGETKLMDLLEIDSIEGDVRRPFDFQTTVEASLFMGSIDITAIGIDGQVSIEDPTSTEGKWIDLGTDTATLSLLNPDYLLLQAVSIVHDAELDGDEKFDGVETRKVTGTVTLPDVTGEIDPAGAAALSTEPLDVTVWIDERHYILGIEFVGPVLESESVDVTRLITFSAFNEPVEIEKPAS